MSETTLEWQETSRITRKANELFGVNRTMPIPSRKYLGSEYANISIESFSNVAYAKANRLHSAIIIRPGSILTSAHVIGHENPNNIIEVVDSGQILPTDGLGRYPYYLVKLFGIGLVLFSIGLLLLLAAFFGGGVNIKVGGACALGLGSITVILALLRGQDLDEQAG